MFFLWTNQGTYASEKGRKGGKESGTEGSYGQMAGQSTRLKSPAQLWSQRQSWKFSTVMVPRKLDLRFTPEFMSRFQCAYDWYLYHWKLKVFSQPVIRKIEWYRQSKNSYPCFSMGNPGSQKTQWPLPPPYTQIELVSPKEQELLQHKFTIPTAVSCDIFCFKELYLSLI